MFILVPDLHLDNVRISLDLIHDPGESMESLMGHSIVHTGVNDNVDILSHFVLLKGAGDGRKPTLSWFTGDYFPCSCSGAFRIPYHVIHLSSRLSV